MPYGKWNEAPGYDRREDAKWAYRMGLIRRDQVLTVLGMVDLIDQPYNDPDSKGEKK